MGVLVFMLLAINKSMYSLMTVVNTKIRLLMAVLVVLKDMIHLSLLTVQ